MWHLIRFARFLTHQDRLLTSQADAHLLADDVPEVLTPKQPTAVDGAGACGAAIPVTPTGHPPYQFHPHDAADESVAFLFKSVDFWLLWYEQYHWMVCVRVCSLCQRLRNCIVVL